MDVRGERNEKKGGGKRIENERGDVGMWREEVEIG